ncbi:Fe-S cluster assembly ATPase SufC [Candidatus Woesearchaeota archaeon]|nr:Fe-S cluster assembly ATPase SufC [Candidatus Woesearchaeota archaeon]
MTTLEIKDLNVSIKDKEIVKGLSLKVKQGEVHALMGPNGSGKSTLSFAIMGHPRYQIKNGSILIDNESILGTSPDERAKKGLFLSFQYPSEIPGVKYSNFLRLALNSLRKAKSLEPVSVIDFHKMFKEQIKNLGIDDSFASRYLNEGFSGGEKKRSEILQLSILKPNIAILDETDSGLDIDALRIVAENINRLAKEENIGVLIITHYQRILRHLHPDFVHVMVDGKIVKSGGKKLAEELEEKGYSDYVKEVIAE